VAQRVGRGIALLFHDRGTRRGKWSAARPGRTLPRGKNRCHFTGGCVGPRAGLDGRKISSPPGFDPGPSSLLSVAIPTELPGPHTHIYIYIYTGCPWRNVPYFGRVFLRSNYTDITPKKLYPKLNGFGNNGQRILKF